MGDPTIPTPQMTKRGKFWTSTWSDPRRPGEKRGRGHCKRFGNCKEVGRAEAMRRFQRWMDKEFPTLKRQGAAKYTVDQLCQDYYAQMGKRYIVEGKHTTSIVRIRIALDSFRAMYGSDEADETTAGKVAAWLEGFIHERLRVAKGKAKLPKTKESANLGLSYIKRMYRWGAKFGRVSDVAAGSVQLVENLRADHPEPRKKDAVRPVDWSDVQKTLATPQGKRLANEVMVLWHTGMRPGEVLQMRPCDISFTGDVPVYTPRRHKNTHRGQVRKVPLGPRAWAIVKPLLPSKTDALIFSRPWNGRKWETGKFYHAVRRAARAAKVGEWTPNQIRHSYATRVAEEYGEEAVTVMLGHDDERTQRVYVEKTLRRAIALAREVG